MREVCSTHVAFCVLAGRGGEVWDKLVQRMLRYMLSCRWHSMGLVNTYLDTLCVLAGMFADWSKQVEVRVVSLLTWEEFGEPRSLAWNEILSALVEMHFMFNLAWERFPKHKLRFILCPRWHAWVSSTHAFCFLAGILGIW
jgi:hypothetical protein